MYPLPVGVQQFTPHHVRRPQRRRPHRPLAFEPFLRVSQNSLGLGVAFVTYLWLDTCMNNTHTEALAARSAALAATKITFAVWKDSEGERGDDAHMEAIDAYAAACAEVEAIEAAYDAVTPAHTYNPAATPALLAAIKAANAAHAVAVANA